MEIRIDSPPPLSTITTTSSNSNVNEIELLPPVSPTGRKRAVSDSKRPMTPSPISSSSSTTSSAASSSTATLSPIPLISSLSTNQKSQTKNSRTRPSTASPLSAPPFPSSPSPPPSSDSSTDSSSIDPTQNESSSSSDSFEHIRVLARFRPESVQELAREGSSRCVEFDPDERHVSMLNNNASDFDASTTPRKRQQEFAFDRVFAPHASQEEVYEQAAAPIVGAVMSGFNASIIAYGQTGSGKTFTMQGPGFSDSSASDEPAVSFNADVFASRGGTAAGISPRIMDDIFTRIACAPVTTQYLVRCSFIEIYCEKIYDLLVDPTTTNTDPSKNNASRALTIHEDKDRGLYVRGAREMPVRDKREATHVMLLGMKNRFVAATAMNAESSRSHSIFLITIIRRDLANSSDSSSSASASASSASAITVSQLYLVDLAGSEKVEKTGSVGQRLQEAKAINTSLLALKNVIFSLSSISESSGNGKQQQVHIPYRNSKLTRLLQNSIGGNAKCVVIITCSPNSFNAIETLSSLRFGDRTRKIKNAPKKNADKSYQQLKAMFERAQATVQAQAQHIQHLENQIEILKKSSKKDRRETDGDHDDEEEKDEDGPFIHTSFIESFFICPLTKKMMENPVIALDSFTYEKTAIETYLKHNKFLSPMTNEKVPSPLLIPNLVLANQIKLFREMQERKRGKMRINLGKEIAPENLFEIFQFLDFKNLMIASRVCQYWKRATEEDLLWETLLRSDFPKVYEKMTGGTFRAAYFNHLANQPMNEATRLQLANGVRLNPSGNNNNSNNNSN